jgi:hypothetical protein
VARHAERNCQNDDDSVLENLQEFLEPTTYKFAKPTVTNNELL